jgi:hypothetical protein
MLFVTAGTNTVNYYNRKNFCVWVECHEFPLRMPPGRRCCSAAPDICCLSVEALQNYTIRLNESAIRQGIEDCERTELFYSRLRNELHNLKKARAANTNWVCNSYIGWEAEENI